MKPIIGITAECVHDPDEPRTRGKIELNWNYAELVAEAGGVPLIVPPMADPEEVLKLIDGWLIPGGQDIDAANWGEENHPQSKLQDPTRFELESDLFRQADPAMPIFGICYGCQAINVMRGGSLEQQISDRISNARHEGGTLETASISGDSKLAEVAETSAIEGKSYHHQAISAVGKGLRVVGKHEDGTVEAIEATDRPWLIGVQWHPERSPESEATRKLFRDFVRAASDFATSKKRSVGSL